MSRLRAWLRVVIPHEGIVAALLALYLGAETYYSSWKGSELDIERGMFALVLYVSAEPTHRVAGAGLVFAAALYGVYRAIAFHPLYLKSYRRWLATTPWHSGLPLPMGPLHFVPQDLLLVGGVALLAWWRHDDFIGPLPVVLAFVFAYELVMTISLAFLKECGFAYLAAFSLAALVRVWSYETAAAALGIAAITYAVVQLGLKHALVRFAGWPTESFDRHFRITPVPPQNRENTGFRLGWPYGFLHPDPKVPGIRALDGVLVSLLAGCWTHALIAAVMRADPLPPYPKYFFASMVALNCAVVRTCLYVWGCLPPISLVGRLGTGRLIIPGYDKIFVAPLLAIIPCAVLVPLVRQYDFDWSFADPPFVAAALLPVLVCGPTLRNWRITGGHRLSPTGMISNREFQPLP